MTTSILSRKRDLAYLAYFCIHIPVMFLIDLTSLYPPALTPAFSTAIRQYHITTFQDQFFVSPPAFFIFFMWMEVFFHVPVSIWSVFGLYYNSPKVPLVLLVYGLQTFMTTATCIADYASWTTVFFNTKLNLTSLYGPYLALSFFMSVDMVLRLNSVINRDLAAKSGTPKTRRATRKSAGKKEL